MTMDTDTEMDTNKDAYKNTDTDMIVKKNSGTVHIIDQIRDKHIYRYYQALESNERILAQILAQIERNSRIYSTHLGTLWKREHVAFCFCIVQYSGTSADVEEGGFDGNCSLPNLSIPYQRDILLHIYC
jgi:hypothetical protein